MTTMMCAARDPINAGRSQIIKAISQPANTAQTKVAERVS
jgi:hypothetical protein